jgi:23S rRNA (cytosine1962-C5)-methyltransferase
MTAATVFEASLRAAMTRRSAFISRLATERTNCCRLLHGTQEGVPGVTLDRYGDLALLQSFHAPVADDEVAVVRRVLDDFFPALDLVYNDRSGPGSRVRNGLNDAGRRAAETDRIICENGVFFHVRARHRGHDPWLFLDLRTTRRAVMDEAEGRTVLNLFAYTCGLGVAAAVAGAHRVVNVDFSESSLAVGTANGELNGVTSQTVEIVSDVFPAIRQFAGIRQPSLVRGRQLPRFPRLEPEHFDLVFLDPPRLAKSRFGVVDVIRDYQSVFKLALGVVSAGGILYCTCNVARVEEKEWHAQLRRCADKCGRPIREFDVLRPGEDFPSIDGRAPLKVVRLVL